MTTDTTGRAGVAPSLAKEAAACSQCGGGDAFHSMRLKAPLCEACRARYRTGQTGDGAMCPSAQPIAAQMEPPSISRSGPEKAETADEGTHALYRAILRCASWSTPR